MTRNSRACYNTTRFISLLASCFASLSLTAFSAIAQTPEQAIAELQRTLDAPLRRADQPAPAGLLARLQAQGIPGMSIAVIHRGQLHWAQGFGEARAGVPMTAQTQLQAGSISKAVAAIGALRLAEAQGVGLDDDLRAGLQRWQPVPEEGPASHPARYTLRRLLSHTAGLGVHGYGGYAVGAPLPTVVQILDGLAPANSAPVRPVQPAGQGFLYSGGGSTIVQLWTEEQTGKPFADAMQAWVLGPLGMTSSSYQQPPQDALSPRAYSHQGLGKPEPGGWRVYPEQQAAGLWTTPSDIARMLLAMQAARRGEASPVSPALARSATTPVAWPVGLGFFMEGPQDAPRRFGHNGSNQGFESLSVADLDGGEGLIIMANSNNTWGVIDAVRRTLARVYGWTDQQAASALATQALPAAALQMQGEYPQPDRPPLRLRQHKGALWVDGGPGNWQRLWLTADGSYASEAGLRGLRISAQGLQMGADSAWVPRQPLAPFKAPAIFLRGNMNDWQPTQALRRIGPGRWQVELTLPAGKHEFKLGDASWAMIDIGSNLQTALPLGSWQNTTWRAGNMRLEPTRRTHYLLELRLKDSPEPAQLRVQEIH